MRPDCSDTYPHQEHEFRVASAAMDELRAGQDASVLMLTMGTDHEQQHSSDEDSEGPRLPALYPSIFLTTPAAVLYDADLCRYQS